MYRYLWVVVILIGACSSGNELENAKRIALVIGNADYQNAPSLDNPVNDANDITASLQQLGFEVLLGRDMKRREMLDAVHLFGQRLQNGGVSLFYFSGHGLQSQQRNYLVPVNALIRTEAEIEYESVDAGRVLAQMEQANSDGLNIVILDACRDNPYQNSALKGLAKGLAKMDSPKGTLIAYATAPNTASYGDSEQRNSIYTKYLLDGLRDKPYLSALDMLTEVASQVVAETNGLQVPWQAASLTKRFCFGQCGQLHQSPSVGRLLQACQAHFEAGRLTRGRGGNALACYEAVLNKDPTNVTALQGIAQIEAHYAKQAEQALQLGQLDRAKQALGRLRELNSESPRLAALQRQLADRTEQSDFSAQLHTCQLHFNANRLTTGRGGTALDCYQEVLKLEPNNAAALAGLAQIEARYVEWAERALQQRNPEKAKGYLASLRRVNPDSSQLAALEARLVQETTLVAGQVFRDRLKDDSLGPEMVMIPAGRFKMGDIQGGGDDNEQPVHSVSVQPFALGKYELTNAEFVRFLNSVNRRGTKQQPWFETHAEDSDSPIIGSVGHFRVESGYDKHPVVEVSWYGASAYMEWLSQQTGHEYRLPTEAEWEYAARAGTTTKYWWGNDIGSNNANCRKNKCGDSFDNTAPVGSFAANPFGLYDTAGNVWEWTCSPYKAPYDGTEITCISKNNANNYGRFVLRGGAWGNYATGTRSAYRNNNVPTYRGGNYGFRPARIK